MKAAAAKPSHAVVSRDEWISQRKELLEREKQLTRLGDEVSRRRRELPWVRVDKRYVFEGTSGKVTLAELFDGRSQLIVQHFMMGPGWEEGCVGCSFGADHVDAAWVHLTHHDVTPVAVSRAPWADLAVFKQRMGWRFNWVSSFGSDFNFDFQVSFRPEEIATGRVYYNYEPVEFVCDELPGTSVFFKDDDGTIYHTYSGYGRGGESALTTYALLDLTPKGRNENGPNGNLTDWVRHHDRYGV